MYKYIIQIIIFLNIFVYSLAFAEKNSYNELLLTIENKLLKGCDTPNQEYKGVYDKDIRGNCRHVVDMLDAFWAKNPNDKSLSYLMKRILLKYDGMNWFRTLGELISQGFSNLWQYDLELAEKIGMEMWKESNYKFHAYYTLKSIKATRMKKENLIQIANDIKNIDDQIFIDKVVNSKKAEKKRWCDFIKSSEYKKAIELLPCKK